MAKTPAASTLAARPEKMNWWYHGIIDWMLSHPEGTLTECAAHMGVTPTWLWQIRSSDSFKEQYALRRAELNRMIHEQIAGKMGRVAKEGLNILEDRLKHQEEKRVPTETVVEITDKMLSHLGFGGPKGSGAVNINVQTAVDTGASTAAILAARQQIRHDQAKTLEHAPQVLAEPVMEAEMPEQFNLFEPDEGVDQAVAFPADDSDSSESVDSLTDILP